MHLILPPEALPLCVPSGRDYPSQSTAGQGRAGGGGVDRGHARRSESGEP
jgi:hypothetical protein